jgi:hypothetical protein
VPSLFVRTPVSRDSLEGIGSHRRSEECIHVRVRVRLIRRYDGGRTAGPTTQDCCFGLFGQLQSRGVPGKFGDQEFLDYGDRLPFCIQLFQVPLQSLST